MKKLLSLCAAAALAAALAPAQEGAGLTVGVEFGIGDVNRPKQGQLEAATTSTRSMPPPAAEVMKPYLRTSVGYEHSSPDGAVDVAASLAYDTGLYTADFNYDFYKSWGGAAFYRLAASGEKETPQNLYSGLMVGYNLRLGDASTLSVILENSNSFVLAPRTGGGAVGVGVVRPGVKFSQGFGDPGDFHIQADFPVASRHLNDNSVLPLSGLDATLGWASTFGLGVRATGHVLFTRSSRSLFPPGIAERPRMLDDTLEMAAKGGAPQVALDMIKEMIANWKPLANLPPTNGLTGISLAVTYESGPVYAELALTTPTKKYGLLYSWFEATPDYGMVITPLFQYTFHPGLAAYASLKVDGLFARAEQSRVVEVGLTPAIGFKYSY